MSKLGLFETVAACRHFFNQNDFLETPTPPIVENPGMEAHLHPFQVKSPYHQKDYPLYLHTSPEFHMKELLSEGFSKIYNLGYCFRDEPASQTHRPQFLMLEWYRANAFYHEIKVDTLNLIQFVYEHLLSKGISLLGKQQVTEVTVDELFQQKLNFSILDFLDPVELRKKILKDFPKLLNPETPNLPWEDYFYLLFLNEIEPHFKNYNILVVDKFPAPLAALSTIDPKNPNVCQRFEIYLNGLELCNCFNELTNLPEQKQRMKEESKKKAELYGYELNEPNTLYKALERGIPPSAGNALGVERLYMGLSPNPEQLNAFFS
ncbi:MAG: hypothetical protein K9K67_07695 [Bacteriovoracaceae bacterium]|nr:hypothetical protein [Bacteriovoracaceae bacterium]